MTPIIHHKNCLVCGSDQLPSKLKLKDHSISKEDFELAQCSNCTFVFTQNIPTQKEIGPYYVSEDYISHSDTKEGLINSLYHTVREWMLKSKKGMISTYAPSKKLLDVGCGTGYFLNFMKNNGYDVLGVEPDENARELGVKNFGLKVHSPEKLLNDGIDQKFGAITMWHVMEHVHEPDRYFQTYRQLLEDEGVLVIAVPNCNSYDARHYKGYWAAYDVPRHLWHFTPKTMKQLGEKNGFELIAQKRLPYDAFYCSLLSEKYKGSSLAVVRGFFVGGISWLNSLFKKEETSSLTYIFKMSKGVKEGMSE